MRQISPAVGPVGGGERLGGTGISAAAEAVDQSARFVSKDTEAVEPAGLVGVRAIVVVAGLVRADQRFVRGGFSEVNVYHGKRAYYLWWSI